MATYKGDESLIGRRERERAKSLPLNFTNGVSIGGNGSTKKSSPIRAFRMMARYELIRINLI